ncbi:MAG: PD-(D/E)XK nuclease family protein, partial [Desulfomonile tiedjei]|nr:PD-(D/E)XK nuclease family protein [Desulfomonile tiedjei]
KRFLTLFARVDGKLDEAALEGLLMRIRDMESMVRQWGPLNIEMLKWLGNLAQEVQVMGSGPKPGAIYVTGIESGGLSGRKHTFIVGLDDGRFPAVGMQDPVILDSERESLSRATSTMLPTAKEGLTLQLQKFSYLFSRLSGPVTLSYSCKSIADDREMFPSPVMLSAYRIISQNRTVDINDLVGSLQPPVSFAPLESGKSLDMKEWWLSKLCAPGPVLDTDRLLKSHFPHLARGKEAARLRGTSEFTMYDGCINSPDKSLDPTEDVGPRLSVSRLEALGACPRHYFFSNVLGIEPPEDVSVDKDTWLNDAQFGTLAHDVFYEFVSQWLGNNWPPDFSRDLDNILDIAQDKAKRERKSIPSPSEAAFQQQLEALFRACKTFLAHESKQLDAKPLFLEASIGLKRGYSKGTPLDTADEIIFDLPGGTSVRLGGRIDRIDKVDSGSPGEYIIYDYKTGSSYKFRSKDIFWCGRSVQHGIYVHLVEQALQKQFPGSRVSLFTYFFPGIKEDGLLIQYKSYQLSDLPKVVQLLCNIAAKGAFLGTNQPGTDCTYCPYPEICGKAEVVEAQAAAKLGNINEPRLRDMRELRNREPKKSK